MSSPSQSSVGRLLSGNSAASSSNVQQRFFHFFANGFGCVAITIIVNREKHGKSTFQTTAGTGCYSHCLGLFSPHPFSANNRRDTLAFKPPSIKGAIAGF